GFIFSSEEELAFLRRRFPAASLNGPVVGTAVDPPAKLSPDAFRETYGIDGPFVVYVGRMDPAKGVGELLHHFLAYQRQTGAALEYLLTESAVRRGLGEQGRRYVAANYRWAGIVEKYRELIRALSP